MLAGGVGSSPGAALAQTAPATADEALKRLLDGNRRFTQGKITAANRDLAHLKAVAPKQAPFAAFLSCADSRVPVEIIFDQGFGDMFVVRVAGNVAAAEETASLEFGTLMLGAKVLVVLGHSGCGAVKAALEGTDARTRAWTPPSPATCARRSESCVKVRPSSRASYATGS
ncbi:MAG: carbonic anhydrase [Candidatus Rokuibacteriota bacterium]